MACPVYLVACCIPAAPGSAWVVSRKQVFGWGMVRTVQAEGWRAEAVAGVGVEEVSGSADTDRVRSMSYLEWGIPSPDLESPTVDCTGWAVT